MAIIQSGLSGTSLMTVDPTLTAARASLRPIEQLGTYQVGLLTGALTGVAAGGPIFSMRFVAGTAGTQAQLVVIQKITINYVLTTGFTTAQQIGFNAFVARSFTASDSGGSATTLSGNNNKNRTSMPTSQISATGDMRIASTAALTAGTRTLDTNAFYTTNGWAGSTLLTTGAIPLQQVDVYQNTGTEYPLILANNEGIVITNAVAMGATGVMTVAINVEWTESASTAAGIAY
jgi:hypothetical protein